MRNSWLVGAVLLMVAQPAVAFDPTKYGGTWTGTWNNKTFKVSGVFQATATVANDGQSITIDHTIDNLFACGSTGRARVLTAGVDYTDAGLNFMAQNSAWGETVVTSKTKSKFEKIKMAGTAPCNTAVTKWVIKAKLTDTLLSGKMKIIFAKGNKPRRAADTFSATKQ
jgi:hypothetical protein